MPSYKEGAASLVPLIVELAQALEVYHEFDVGVRHQNGSVYFVAKEALQSIEKFLEGE